MLRVNAINRQGLLKCLTFNPKSLVFKTVSVPCHPPSHPCIAMLMQEGYGKEALFNQQSHWQAVYRILVDKGYCRDSDFDGFDMFIRTVMPEEVNKPYSKGSVKQISQTDFVRPF